MRELHQIPLANLTTLQVGGAAQRVVDIENETELAELLSALHISHESVFVLGGGSNVVAPDAGWPGTIVRPAIRKVSVQLDGQDVLLQVGAGEIWDDIVALCTDNCWTGITCLSGIPGWAGAAPIQNIGAYGCEVFQALTGVRVVVRSTRLPSLMTNEQCAFAYRSSVFRGSDQFIVTEISLRLHRGGANKGETVSYAELAKALNVRQGACVPPARVREAVLALRCSKGMVVDSADPESRSAGSYFVNPVVDASTMRQVESRAVMRGAVEHPLSVPRYQVAEGCFKLPAAWLIEQSGFRKGMTIGGAGISRKHALAIVNCGGTAADIIRLEHIIRRGVKEAFGIELSREPILLELLEHTRS